MPLFFCLLQIVSKAKNEHMTFLNLSFKIKFVIFMDVVCVLYQNLKKKTPKLVQNFFCYRNSQKSRFILTFSVLFDLILES